MSYALKAIRLFYIVTSWLALPLICLHELSHFVIILISPLRQNFKFSMDFKGTIGMEFEIEKEECTKNDIMWLRLIGIAPLALSMLIAYYCAATLIHSGSTTHLQFAACLYCIGGFSNIVPSWCDWAVVFQLDVDYDLSNEKLKKVVKSMIKERLERIF
jgi:hypothetical protein